MLILYEGFAEKDLSVLVAAVPLVANHNSILVNTDAGNRKMQSKETSITRASPSPRVRYQRFCAVYRVEQEEGYLHRARITAAGNLSN